MGEWPHLSNAPIVEAILDIRTTFAALPKPADLEAFQDGIRERYPVRLGRIAWLGTVQVEADALHHATRRGPEGFLFRDHEGRRSVQVRQDGFTFNWLKPYDTWEALRDQAREHWERYRETFGPDSVGRIALRYINRLEIPVPFSDFREYVRTAPDIAPGLPQGVRTFLMRLEIVDDVRGLMAVVTETIEPLVADRSRLPLILDIDVIRESTFTPDSPAIWETFEKIHDFKNEIFFKTITEKAEELFR